MAQIHFGRNDVLRTNLGATTKVPKRLNRRLMLWKLIKIDFNDYSVLHVSDGLVYCSSFSSDCISSISASIHLTSFYSILFYLWLIPFRYRVFIYVLQVLVLLFLLCFTIRSGKGELVYRDNLYTAATEILLFIACTTLCVSLFVIFRPRLCNTSTGMDARSYYACCFILKMCTIVLY